MKEVNYVEVPATEAADINRGKTEWRNGKCVSLDESFAFKTLFLGHKEEKVISEDGEETVIVKAFPVRVTKPYSRDTAINAAEMEAYSLRTAMEVAAFNASLARKFREDPESEDIKEHDEFIAWVKEELTKIGLGKTDSGTDNVQAVTFADAFRMMRLTAETATLTDEEALSVKSLYPAWEKFIGKPLQEGKKVLYNGELYAVRQDIAEVLENQPPSTDTLALYRVIEEQHAGTLDDPIPYRQNMALEFGKYYTQDKVTYVCIQAMNPMPYDLKDLAAHVEVVK